MSNDYEKKRIQRLLENKTMLADLGLQHKLESQPKQNIPFKKTNETKQPVYSIKERASKRLKGIPPENNGLDIYSLAEQDRSLQDDTEEEIIEKLKKDWLNSIQQKESNNILLDNFNNLNCNHRQLFLIPTGVVGMNDHTLINPVPSQGNEFLWGFCQNLYKRIFCRVNAGDIFLFTSSGMGTFNRIAVVKSKKIVSKIEADIFWSRISFSMGKYTKSNIGFPLLCCLHKPISINWNKKELMRLLGYSDHLQSSRFISHDRITSPNGQIVFIRCLKTLNLETDVLYQNEKVTF